MKTITKFVADDGSEHKSKEDAEKRDMLHLKVSMIMAPLGKHHDDSSKGWVQHNPEAVLIARDQIMDLCREEGLGKHYPIFTHQGREVHPMSMAGRILDDYGGPLNTAWGRFCCIDELGREHNQPYFALNGPDSNQVCIEDRR